MREDPWCQEKDAYRRSPAIHITTDDSDRVLFTCLPGGVFFRLLGLEDVGFLRIRKASSFMIPVLGNWAKQDVGHFNQECLLVSLCLT